MCVTGWARDVTAQYETEIRFAELFESLREGVFFATTSGRILDANPAMVHLLGFDNKEELQSRNLRDLYVNPGELESLFSEIESKGSFRDREVLLRRKDGQVIYCLASGFAMRDTFGNVARLQGTLVDVTERREIERQLHQEQEFVRRLVANFPDLIAVLDRDGAVHLCKPQREGYSGRLAAGIRGTRVCPALGSRRQSETRGDMLRRLDFGRGILRAI